MKRLQRLNSHHATKVGKTEERPPSTVGGALGNADYLFAPITYKFPVAEGDVTQDQFRQIPRTWRKQSWLT